MSIIDFVKFLWKEMAYIILTSVYLVNLNDLNQKLNSLDSLNLVELLMYENSSALKYFALALLLFIVGLFIIICKAKFIYPNEFVFEKSIASIIAIIITFIFLILIFFFINEPILRTIFLVTSAGGGAIIAVSK